MMGIGDPFSRIWLDGPYAASVDAILADQPPWWLGGPAIGLVVVGLFAATDQRLGFLGGYSEIVERVAARSLRFGWKAWFVFGVVGGALVFHVLSGGAGSFEGYGWLTRRFDDATAAAVLFGAGALIGYGAKTAGGCTSGNGRGCAYSHSLSASPSGSSSRGRG